MKLETSSGNFSVEINGEVDMENQEVVAKVIDAGIRYITEREGFGAVYKAVAGEGDKKKLPAKFERKSVLFSKQNADDFKAELEVVLGKLGMFDVKVVEYVAPMEGGLKKATELFNTAKAKGVLEGLAAHESIQYKGDLADSAAFIAHIHAKKYAKVKAEDELAGMGV